MKKIAIILLFLYHPFLECKAQDITPVTEEKLENLADADQVETEDDSYLQELAQFRKNPVNLNTADENELKELRILTDLQIGNLLSYRKLFGRFVSIYELQSVPTWDIFTIKRLLPFVTISSPVSLPQNIALRLKGGDNSLLMRYSQILERSAGFDKSTSGTKYLGSPQKLFFRYRYSYKNLLQFGLAGDKDAGEQFFRGAQRQGFDFYSFHFFTRKIGIIQSLALGDFTVNMGQGLIQWQGLAYGKSADVMGVKRQSTILRPYNSAGEYNFHRGMGITIQKGNIEATGFASLRKISANFVADTVNSTDFFSSFLTSGYNRTPSEIEDRNDLTQTSFGGNVTYRTDRWHIGINGIYYHFSVPIQKRAEPYNLYAISGNNWSNMSIDYSYTYRNFHFFGEAAADKNFDKAMVNGLLVSVDPKVDVSIVQRMISPKFQSINGNSFTENTYPTNETGLYAGISIRPNSLLRFDAYGDLYRFPWLKYLVDAPSYGKDFLAQLTYSGVKNVEVYARFRSEAKQGNQAANTTVTNYLVYLPKQSWRTQISYKISPATTLRSRVELLWYDRNSPGKENGFLTFFDFIYKPVFRPFAANLRLQYFETDGYNSRLYAFEDDVLYSFSIPLFYGKGYRYYINLNYDINKKISIWMRWAQTFYPGVTSIGSGLDQIVGDKRSEIRAETRLLF
ncbi:MAG TPA: helix-hairpin-helix domain-containing protein [Chitinophagaceae bacterium]|nr:helix-hairpin-helix domain-containing protein [Chitinophagaceae bacterium]